MKQNVLWLLVGVLTIILALIIGFFFFTKPSLVKDETVLFCGGIANINCPFGQECKLSSDNPDATGRCVKE